MTIWDTPLPSHYQQWLDELASLSPNVGCLAGPAEDTCPHCTLPVAECECHERGRD